MAYSYGILLCSVAIIHLLVITAHPVDNQSTGENYLISRNEHLVPRNLENDSILVDIESLVDQDAEKSKVINNEREDPVVPTRESVTEESKTMKQEDYISTPAEPIFESDDSTDDLTTGLDPKEPTDRDSINNSDRGTSSNVPSLTDPAEESSDFTKQPISIDTEIDSLLDEDDAENYDQISSSDSSNGSDNISSPGAEVSITNPSRMEILNNPINEVNGTPTVLNQIEKSEKSSPASTDTDEQSLSDQSTALSQTEDNDSLKQPPENQSENVEPILTSDDSVTEPTTNITETESDSKESTDENIPNNSDQAGSDNVPSTTEEYRAQISDPAQESHDPTEDPILNDIDNLLDEDDVENYDQSNTSDQGHSSDSAPSPIIEEPEILNPVPSETQKDSPNEHDTSSDTVSDQAIKTEISDLLNTETNEELQPPDLPTTFQPAADDDNSSKEILLNQSENAKPIPASVDSMGGNNQPTNLTETKPDSKKTTNEDSAKNSDKSSGFDNVVAPVEDSKAQNINLLVGSNDTSNQLIQNESDIDSLLNEDDVENFDHHDAEELQDSVISSNDTSDQGSSDDVPVLSTEKTKVLNPEKDTTIQDDDTSSDTVSNQASTEISDPTNTDINKQLQLPDQPTTIQPIAEDNNSSKEIINQSENAEPVLTSEDSKEEVNRPTNVTETNPGSEKTSDEDSSKSDIDSLLNEDDVENFDHHDAEELKVLNQELEDSVVSPNDTSNQNSSSDGVPVSNTEDPETLNSAHADKLEDQTNDGGVSTNTVPNQNEETEASITVSMESDEKVQPSNIANSNEILTTLSGNAEEILATGDSNENANHSTILPQTQTAVAVSDPMQTTNEEALKNLDFTNQSSDQDSDKIPAFTKDESETQNLDSDTHSQSVPQALPVDINSVPKEPITEAGTQITEQTENFNNISPQITEKSAILNLNPGAEPKESMKGEENTFVKTISQVDRTEPTNIMGKNEDFQPFMQSTLQPSAFSVDSPQTNHVKTKPMDEDMPNHFKIAEQTSFINSGSDNIPASAEEHESVNDSRIPPKETVIMNPAVNQISNDQPNNLTNSEQTQLLDSHYAQPTDSGMDTTSDVSNISDGGPSLRIDQHNLVSTDPVAESALSRNGDIVAMVGQTAYPKPITGDSFTPLSGPNQHGVNVPEQTHSTGYNYNPVMQSNRIQPAGFIPPVVPILYSYQKPVNQMRSSISDFSNFSVNNFNRAIPQIWNNVRLAAYIDSLLLRTLSLMTNNPLTSFLYMFISPQTKLNLQNNGRMVQSNRQPLSVPPVQRSYWPMTQQQSPGVRIRSRASWQQPQRLMYQQSQPLMQQQPQQQPLWRSRSRWERF